MKAKFTFIMMMALAIGALGACQNLEDNPSPYSDNEMASTKDFDVAGFLSSNCLTASVGSNTISIAPNAPFKTRIPEGNDYKAENRGFQNNGTISLTMNNIPAFMNNQESAAYFGNPYGNIPSYEKGKESYFITRDVILFVCHFEYRNVEGFGDFLYPVRVRQAGPDGTYYLSAEQLREWKAAPVGTIAKMFGANGQRYIKGTVTRIGETSVKELKSGYELPWIFEGKRFAKATLEVKDITVEVDGEQIDIEVSYLREYKLLDKLNLSTGSTVEIAFRSEGATRTLGKLHVAPYDIQVI